MSSSPMATPSDPLTITTAPTDFPVLHLGPAGADIKSAGGAQSRPPSPCSPLSESESIPSSYTSDSSANKWTPAGVYVPIHRRDGSESSTATSVSSSPRSSKLSRANFSCASLQFTTNFHLRPRPRKYTRAELLSLAPASLVQASLHPIITPQIIAKHPRILRIRGEGVFRALDMARQDLYRDYFANASAGANKNVYTNATMNDFEMRRARSRALDLAMPLCAPTWPGNGGPPQPGTLPASTPVPSPSPSPDPSRSTSPSPSRFPPPAQAQSNKTGRRARGRRVRCQRNFASAPTHVDATMACPELSSSSPPTAAPTSAPTMNAPVKTSESENTKPGGDLVANFPKLSHSPNRANPAGSRRQVRMRAPAKDVSSIGSWRAPLSQSLSQVPAPAQAGTVAA